MNLHLHFLLFSLFLQDVVYCLDIRCTNRSWMMNHMSCNNIGSPNHCNNNNNFIFREQSSNNQNYNHHGIFNKYSKNQIKSCRSNVIVHWSMKNENSDVNKNNDEDNDDGWGSSTTTTSTSNNDLDVKRDKMIKELSNLKQQQQQARNNKLENISTNDNDSQRDLFIPIVTIISIVGFGGAYMYETIRLYNNGELYLPFLPK